MNGTRIVAILTGAAACFAALVAVASAAPGPGWELTANTYPTNLVHGANEVQQVTASEEGGTFTLTYKGEETGAIADHAADAEVQAALEALATVGAGDVEVTGAVPGVYAVTFVGALGHMKSAELEGSGAGVTVTTEGYASGTIAIDLFNTGAAESNGAITVTDTLPHGLRAKEAGELTSPGFFGEKFGVVPAIRQGVWDCTGNATGPEPHVAGATVVTCTNDPVGLPKIDGGGGTPTFKKGGNHPQPIVGIAVEAEDGVTEGTKAGGEANRVTAAGGGAPETAVTTEPITVGTKDVPTGITESDAWFSNADGTVDRQAGSHPYIGTFVFDVATALNSELDATIPGGELRNLETVVPAGLVGDLHKIPQCTRQQLFNSACPTESMVGRLQVQAIDLGIVEQVFNMQPAPGVPAELGFNYGNVPVYVTFSVRSGSDYGVVAHVTNIPQREAIQSILTLWGSPAESSHDIWRSQDTGCSQEDVELGPFNGSHINYCYVPPGRTVVPFLRLPTTCSGTPSYSFRDLGSWQEPGQRTETATLAHNAADEPTGFTGCEALEFKPLFTLLPESSQTDTPTGLTAEVQPPVGGAETSDALSPADLRDTTVTLPEGLVVNPGQAAGLQVCPAGRPGPGLFGNALTTPEESARGEEDTLAASCPDASKVGTVIVKSSLIEADAQKQLEGSVYVLPSNPPEIKILVAASADGVNVKLAGTVRLDEQTGQLRATFEDTPQLPFTDFVLKFAGGARAALDTPTRCGSYLSEANFTPWSAPSASNWLQDAGFATTEGSGGGSCPSGALPFSPAFSAGSTSARAGGFTSFTTQLQRPDGQQRVERLQVKTPLGLAGLISSVPLCPEPQAQQGTCPQASQIGHATVTSGPGPNPLSIPQPGEPVPAIYLTGPYAGAPFGLSIVTRALAGPFDLGTIVTRARIEVDPTTAQVTITTDPLPPIVKGVPTDLRSISAVIDRPNFIFNPTNCEPQTIAGTAWGTAPPGGSEPARVAALSSHFAVSACRELPFAPTFSVATSGKSSKAGGASLRVRVADKGGEANIHKVSLQLPLQLPSRLTTLQKACPDEQFERNPAACPEGSLIGSATAHTPVLTAPLTGPAYLVSHASAAFPDLEIVLQGEGVKIVLDGKTDIKKGITYSRFETVPDAPISSFEVTLPEGPHSALAAPGGNLCGQKLMAPTILTAQNGALKSQNTRIQVEGCAKALSVVSKALKKRTLTLHIYAPGAGRVTASGRDLSSASKAYSGQEDQTITLTQRRGGRLKTKVKLRFTPVKGAKQTKTVAVTFRR
jgi:hypothetical protein